METLESRTLVRGRLDRQLVELGLVESRQRAQALIATGRVRIDGVTERRFGRMIGPDQSIELDLGPAYASRGSLKLEPVLEALQVEVEGRICADIGASTGGFTDVLLRRGARRVYAVDVGRGLLLPRLAGDPRVVVMDRTNIRHLAGFPEPVDLITVDVSFIGLELVLSALHAVQPDARVLALFKPQFQAGRRELNRQGVVRSQAAVDRALDALLVALPELGYRLEARMEAGLKGANGNQEVFLWLEPVSVVASREVDDGA